MKGYGKIVLSRTFKLKKQLLKKGLERLAGRFLAPVLQARIEVRRAARLICVYSFSSRRAGRKLPALREAVDRGFTNPCGVFIKVWDVRRRSPQTDV
jgi:hypothetical protein